MLDKVMVSILMLFRPRGCPTNCATNQVRNFTAFICFVKERIITDEALIAISELAFW